MSTTAEAWRAFLETPLDAHLAARTGADPAAAVLRLFQEAARRVPAYRAFLDDAGVDPAAVHTPGDLGLLPLTDKDGYLRRHPLPDLCMNGTLEGSETIAFSSGSTGEPFYFPRGVRHELEVAWRFEQVFRDAFEADRLSTLAVVCFPLGTWVGGMYTAACCRMLAAKGYRLLVVTPGNQPAEILRAVAELGPLHQQVVLLGYPPFLKDVVDGASAQGLDWSGLRLRLVMAGEVVSEAWREILAERTGERDLLRFSASLYGTADAGVLGHETPLSVAVRRAAAARPELAEALFGERRLPTLVQYDPHSRWFEAVDGRLVFSGDAGGVPLLRYAIGDTGGVLPFGALLEALAEWGLRPADELRQAGIPVRDQPFAWVFGRPHHAVSFYGANVFVEMVRLGLERPEVRARVTGRFVMGVAEDASGDRWLELDVELARGVDPSAVSPAEVARLVRDEVARASGEFASYVPPARQLPRVRVWPWADPARFPPGVKHRYVRS